MLFKRSPANGAAGSPAPSKDETEIKQRRRLSKPLTNKSAPSFHVVSVQRVVLRGNNSSGPELSSSQPTPAPAKDALRDLTMAHVLDADSDSSGQEAQARRKSRRPLSAIFNSSRISASTISKLSTELFETTSSSLLSSVSPLSSRDELRDEPIYPPTRRSSFQPGMATRPIDKSSQACPVPEPATPVEERHYAVNPTTEAFQEHPKETELDEEEWKPPPPMIRTETPAGLDYTHLGGLRLGSLHIVNGRASPAPSELSKLFKTSRPVDARRDVSSDYAESICDADDQTSQLPRKTPLGRTVSMSSLYTTHDPQQEASPHLLESHVPVDTWPALPPTPRSLPDRASMMASEYIAELPNSPFTSQRPRSSTESVIRHSIGPATDNDEKVEDDAAKSPLADSVLDRAIDLAEDKEEKFEDEAVEASPADSVIGRSIDRAGEDGEAYGGDAVNISLKGGRVTVHSWYTAVDGASDMDDPFQSTVEFRPVESPTRLRPPTATKESEKPDSGYGSLRTLSRDGDGEDKQSLVQQRESQPPGPPVETVNITSPSLGQTLKRQSILKQNSSMTSTLPTFTNLQSVTSPTLSTNSASSAGSDVRRKTRKLQKRRPFSMPVPPKFITVQGATQPDFDFVPPVPPEIQANLSIRTQTVPELQHTFKSREHIRNQQSIPELSAALGEIRFPSPTLEEGNAGNTRARPPLQLNVRRLSLLGRAKTEPTWAQQQDSNGISEAAARAIINNGYAAVGGDPYQLAQGRTQRPHTSAAGSRVMMDDEAAAELARLRSQTFLEREAAGPPRRRSSFNDRGGIPGSNLRPASFERKTPPLPPLPIDYEALQRDRARGLAMPTAHPRLRSERDNEYHEGSAPPPPPPPPHSPRPVYIDPEDVAENDAEARTPPPPPPPPSHSPRPVTLTPSPRHSPQRMTINTESDEALIWAAQAESRKAARRPLPAQAYLARPYPSPYPSSSPPRPRSRQQVCDGDWAKAASQTPTDCHSPQQRHPPDEEESLYPTIPPRRRPLPSSANVSANAHTGVAWQPIPDTYSLAFADGPGSCESASSRFQPGQRPLPPPAGAASGAGAGAAARATASDEYGVDNETNNENNSNRPPSRLSNYAGSMAEDVHPPSKDQGRRPDQPAPQFGRYGGGLGYGYAGAQSGCGGSAGTRSVSGVSSAGRKGLPLSENFGVDLSDVPIIAGVVKRS